MSLVLGSSLYSDVGVSGKGTMTSFNRTNERGSVTRKQGEAQFSFEYWNAFYGTCSFTARIGRDPFSGLQLDRASIEYQRSHLQRGNMEGLFQSAETFFSRELREYGDPSQIDPAERTPNREKARWPLIQQALMMLRG